MTATYQGWQARAPKPCRTCHRPFKPTGPRSKHCPACNPSLTTCRRCDTSYPRHRAHACSITA